MKVYKGKIITVNSNDDVAGYLVEDKGRILFVGDELPEKYASGDKGVLYNVHYPINPEDVKEKGCDYVAALRKVNQSYEY